MLLAHLKTLVTRNMAFQLNIAVEKVQYSEDKKYNIVKTLVLKSNLAKDIPRESIDIKKSLLTANQSETRSHMSRDSFPYEQTSHLCV